jgi:predicted nucleotidyltransferase
MDKNTVVDLLHTHRDELIARFGVKRLDLFGSAARDELRNDSDIDILVEFAGPATFDGYMDLKFHLERVLGRAIDLVTRKGLRAELRAGVDKESIRVA